VALHLARHLLSADGEARFVLSLAFIPVRYLPEGVGLPGSPWAAWLSPLTHALVHGDLVHLTLNCVWLLVFGSILVRRWGSARLLALAAVAAIAGALCFYLFNPRLAAPMVGASGAISGLMGAAMRLLFSGMAQGGPELLREHPEQIRPMPLGEALRDRRLLSAMAMLALVNLIMAYGIGGLNEPGALAWEAHLGGFAVGLLAFAAFDRGTGRPLGIDTVV
jgi:membrane associated rhomboid family serine protease